MHISQDILNKPVSTDMKFTEEDAICDLIADAQAKHKPYLLN